MKTCTGPCRRTLPLDAFHKQSRNPDGRRPECADCRKAARGDRRRLPEAVRAQTGLSPSERAGLDAAAKKAAIRFRAAVAARDAAEVARITGGMSRDGLIALAMVGFEAVTDGWRLLAVTESVDDGMPSGAVRLAAAGRTPLVAGDGSREALSDAQEAAA